MSQQDSDDGALGSHAHGQPLRGGHFFMVRAEHFFCSCGKKE
jgi:hypothetical protein